jgi:hypothetical protein
VTDGVFRSQNLETDLQHRFPYGNESGAFPYKSGGIGVYTGGSMNPKRAFTLIELLMVIASGGSRISELTQVSRQNGIDITDPAWFNL